MQNLSGEVRVDLKCNLEITFQRKHPLASHELKTRIQSLRKKFLGSKSFFIVMFLRFHPTAAQTATASFVTSEDVLPQLNPLLWAGTLRHQHLPIVFVLRIFFFISLFFCHHSTLFYGRHSSVSTFLIFSHSLHLSWFV